MRSFPMTDSPPKAVTNPTRWRWDRRWAAYVAGFCRGGSCNERKPPPRYVRAQDRKGHRPTICEQAPKYGSPDRGAPKWWQDPKQVRQSSVHKGRSACRQRAFARIWTYRWEALGPGFSTATITAPS